MEPSFLEDESSLAALISGFRSGTWPVTQFHHDAHLAVGCCSVLDYQDAVLDRLRDQIRAYNVSQGGENTDEKGYHETITRFWLERVAEFVKKQPVGLSRLELARRAVGEFATRPGLFRDYYTFDVLKSREARQAWVAPDAIAPDRTIPS